LAAEFIRDDLTNKFFDQYTNEMEEGEILTTKNEFLQLMNLKAIDTKTAFRWLKNLGFTYDVQKKFISTIDMKIQRMLPIENNS